MLLKLQLPGAQIFQGGHDEAGCVLNGASRFEGTVEAAPNRAVCVPTGELRDLKLRYARLNRAQLNSCVKLDIGCPG